MLNSERITESQDKLGWRGAQEVSSPTCCSKSVSLRSDWVAQSSVQSGPENLQG